MPCESLQLPFRFTVAAWPPFYLIPQAMKSFQIIPMGGVVIFTGGECRHLRGPLGTKDIGLHEFAVSSHISVLEAS